MNTYMRDADLRRKLRRISVGSMGLCGAADVAIHSWHLSMVLVAPADYAE